MKKGKRRKAHHHHRLEALRVQYAHLNIEEKLEALEHDIWELIKDIPGAFRILERIAEKQRVHR
jgi:hypothetical protein